MFGERKAREGGERGEAITAEIMSLQTVRETICYLIGDKRRHEFSLD